MERQQTSEVVDSRDRLVALNSFYFGHTMRIVDERGEVLHEPDTDQPAEVQEDTAALAA